MDTISVVLIFIVMIPLFFIVKHFIQKERVWRNWKSDVREMSNNYVKARNSIHKTNERYYDYIRQYKKETNPQEKARLFELANKEKIKSEIKWAEHEMNHNATHEAIRRKYANE